MAHSTTELGYHVNKRRAFSSLRSLLLGPVVAGEDEGWVELSSVIDDMQDLLDSDDTHLPWQVIQAAYEAGRIDVREEAGRTQMQIVEPGEDVEAFMADAPAYHRDDGFVSSGEPETRSETYDWVPVRGDRFRAVHPDVAENHLERSGDDVWTTELDGGAAVLGYGETERGDKEHLFAFLNDEEAEEDRVYLQYWFNVPAAAEGEREELFLPRHREHYLDAHWQVVTGLRQRSQRLLDAATAGVDIIEELADGDEVDWLEGQLERLAGEAGERDAMIHDAAANYYDPDVAYTGSSIIAPYAELVEPVLDEDELDEGELGLNETYGDTVTAEKNRGKGEANLRAYLDYLWSITEAVYGG